MPNWPGTLPTKPRQDSYRELQQPGAAIRTPVEQGPPKQRNRFTACIQSFQVDYDMTSAQVDTFWTFYRTTLGNGALAFDGLPHPRTQATVQQRFDVSNPPSDSASGWDSYVVSMNLEILP